MENVNSEMINFIWCHEITDLTQAAESPFSHSRSHCNVILGGLKAKGAWEQPDWYTEKSIKDD